MLKNLVFFNKELKSLNPFAQFHQHIFRSTRSRCSQMFFKIGALKNFAIFRIKKRLQHRCFLVNIATFLRTVFFKNSSGGCFCIFLKVIKQPFRKGYYAVIIFSSQHILETHCLMYEKSNSFVYKFVVNCQVF